MKRCKPSMLALTVLSVGLMAPSMKAHADNPAHEHGREHENNRAPLSVTVAFGAGLNTSGAANHHVVPPTVRIQTGGVVNFAVAGSHQIFVYLPGKTPDQVMVPDSGQFIDDMDQLFYGGINPNGTPPPGVSNSQNRVESVSFSDPGIYLVICNIRSHFLNGMWAFVTVEDPETH
jgi:plastocyanin